MGCQDHGASLILSGNLLNHRPHEAAGFRVHSCGRLVKKNDHGASKQSNSNLKLAFVSSREIARKLCPLFGQIKLFDRFINKLLPAVFRNALDLGVEPKVLLNSHQREENFALWAVSHPFSHLAEIFDHVFTLDRAIAL